MTMLRRLRDDVREFPATTALSALWVAVFAAMAVDQAVWGGGLTRGGFVLGLRNGHKFGDLTLRGLYDGEVWRLVTATFVHYGLLHIGLNLFALYQLGCLVESWYGPGPLVAVYVLTGGGGNLLSALARHALGSDPDIASGGGSTVVMGLVALCAVVGWQARTRVGDHLRDQMLWVLGLTALMGVGLSVGGLPVIDNWGHAGGSAVGGLIGLANRGLARRAGGRLARASGWLGGALITACAVAQATDARTEGTARRQVVEDTRRRLAADERLLLRVDEIRQVYRAVATPRAITRGSVVREAPRRRPAAARPPAPTSPGSPRPAAPTAPSPATKPAPSPVAAPASAPLRLDPEQEFFLVVLTASLRSLGSLGPELDRLGASADFRRAEQILAGTLSEPPTLEEVREFDDRMAAIHERIRRDRNHARVRMAEETE